MAVKASATITLNSVVDIQATYRYYLLQSSTLAKPAKPTTNPPSSSWDDSEPTYTSGSTNSLYYVDLTVFSNGTFKYSEVSLSTSYEAAKEAYNKANNAQNTANSAKESIDNLKVGGRNLLPKSTVFTVHGSATGITASTNSDGIAVFTAASGNANWSSFSVGTMSKVEEALSEGDIFTISFTMRSPDSTSLPNMYIKSSLGYQRLKGSLTSAWSTVYYTSTWKKSGTIEPHFGFSGVVGTYEVKNCKIEKGNKATDWSPAPEDMATASQMSAMETRVVSAEARIEQNEADISITAKKTEVTEMIGNKLSNYYNKTETESKITVAGDSIRSSVAATYTTKDDFNNLTIGGRNLWRYTKEFNPSVYTGWVDNTNNAKQGGYKPYTIVDGFGVARIASSWLDFSQRVPIEQNTYYTLSAWIKWESTAGTMYFYNNGSTPGTIDVTNLVGTSEYKRVSVTFYNTTGTESTCRFECTTATPYLIYGYKFEKGSKATDWTPAPEDVEYHVGGRNLVLGTSSEWKNITVDAWTGMMYYGTAFNSSIKGYHPIEEYGISSGEFITLSADLKSVGKRIALRFDVYVNDAVATRSFGNFIEVGETGRSTLTIQIPENVTSTYLYIGSDGITSSTTTEQYKCLKVEKGNVATAWTKAPEDTDARIDSAYTLIDQNANAIKAQATTIAGVESRTGELEVAADGIRGRVQQIEDTDPTGRNLVSVKNINSGNFPSVTSTKEFALSNVFATKFMDHSDLISILEPSTTYTVSYEVELVEKTSVPTPYDMKVGFLIYGPTSGAWKPFYATMASDAEIGTIQKVNTSFTTSSSWYGDEVILAYCRRWTTEGDYPIGLDGFIVRNFKIEKGSVATEWRPAFEDDQTLGVIKAQSQIEQLVDKISMLVSGDSGETFMEQTPEDWTYSFKEVVANLDKHQIAIDGLPENLNADLAGAKEFMDLNKQYIRFKKIANDDGVEEPCIELGVDTLDESGNVLEKSKYKVIITNTRIMFMEGSATPTYISNETLVSEKVEVTQELKQTRPGMAGGFVWKVRSNGNYGLSWKGGV